MADRGTFRKSGVRRRRVENRISSGLRRGGGEPLGTDLDPVARDAIRAILIHHTEASQ
jgi:hypothetical protein